MRLVADIRTEPAPRESAWTSSRYWCGCREQGQAPVRDRRWRRCDECGAGVL